MYTSPRYTKFVLTHIELSMCIFIYFRMWVVKGYKKADGRWENENRENERKNERKIKVSLNFLTYFLLNNKFYYIYFCWLVELMRMRLIEIGIY